MELIPKSKNSGLFLGVRSASGAIFFVLLGGVTALFFGFVGAAAGGTFFAVRGAGGEAEKRNRGDQGKNTGHVELVEFKD
ncbi:hypothetical protein FEM03_19110 [Phragmitibacter flavus]|uniref:Uncharacterized protein n=1 Tax=Phragmitibacter flavus TaxID=2576071 RepID=A0A5R8KCA1_9BACT|nr:hypothetical protein FEM03_19110 [Phragmitibacter flavus]